MIYLQESTRTAAWWRVHRLHTASLQNGKWAFPMPQKLHSTPPQSLDPEDNHWPDIMGSLLLHFMFKETYSPFFCVELVLPDILDFHVFLQMDTFT